MKIGQVGMLVGLALAGAGPAQASAWISLESGRAEDYRMGAISGGSSLGDEAWAWQASAMQALLLERDSNGQTHERRSGELGLGLGYGAGEDWDLGVDGKGGSDSSNLQWGGGLVTLGGHVGTSVELSLYLRGGSTHYQFAPEQTLRQNRGEVELAVGLGPFTLGGTAGSYNYNRDLNQPGQSSSVVNGGPGGIFGIVGQGTTTSTSSRGPQQDPLLGGFPSRDWSANVHVEPGLDARLGASYTEVEIIESGRWVKLAGAYWRQEWTEIVASKFSWSKAVEGGSDSPYFNLALIWNFDGA